MTEAWFSQGLGPWFSFLSLLALLSLLRPLAERGQHRRFVMSLFAGCIALGGVLLAGGVVAALGSQPPHVVRPLALSGVVVTCVFAGAFVKQRRAYTDGEIRRTIASDL